MTLSRHSGLRAAGLGLALVASGCASNWAYRQGRSEARKGNWDMAVARLTKAAEADPDNLEYRIALDGARASASRMHFEEGMKHLADQKLEEAKNELDLAAKFDPSNRRAIEQLVSVERRIRKRDDDLNRLNDLDAMKVRAQSTRIPVPYLSPRSTAPISLKFVDQSLQKIFDSLGKLAGVNIVMDPDFRDKKVNFDVTGVTFEEALDQLVLLHHLFYKVIDQNTLVIATESPQKRRSYDDLVVQTFYLRYTTTKDVIAVVKGLITGGASFKTVDNATLGAISVIGTPDQVAMAARIIEANDKPRGEVMIEVRILEVNRVQARKMGISLANYEGKVTFAPFSDQLADPVNIRAHLISSVNLADFVVTLPSAVMAKLNETNSGTRILASPRLRAAEGEKTALKVGTEIAIPTTTFTAPQTGVGGSFGPATSFSTRNVGVNLELTPTVSTAGEITLKIAAEFSSVGQQREVSPGLRIPDILTRNVNGILRLRDGETSLIGGLLAQQTSDSASGPIGLNSVPLLNKIFGDRTTDKQDSEVIISITPHLLRAPILEEEDLRPMSIGTEEVKRVPGVREPLLRLAEPAPLPSPSPSPAPAAAPPEASKQPAARPTPAAVAPLLPTSPAEDPLAEPPAGASARPLAPPSAELPPITVRPPGAGAPAPPAPTDAATSGATSAPESGPPPAPSGTGPAGQRPVRAQFMPVAVSVKPGEIGSLSVVLIGAHDLLATEIVLSYDSSVIEAVDMAAGTLLSIDGAPVGAEKQSDIGRYRAHFSRPSPANGNGPVAVFTFRGLKAGNASFGAPAISVTTPAGVQPVSVSGTARVTVEP